MPYTPPAANAVNFALPKRVVTPASNAVNFNFAPNDKGVLGGAFSGLTANLHGTQTFSGSIHASFAGLSARLYGAAVQKRRNVTVNT